jgi:hypothetical protein
MKNNLIICPVGNPLTFDSRFDSDNHWRYTNKQERDYETVVFQYSEFIPEDNTYDTLIKKRGFKWSLAKELFESFDYSKYEYIGFLDDDLITDIQSINNSLKLAKEKDLKIFQLSVTQDSDMFYPILKNKPSISYSKTNFNEVMGPFIHTSLIPLCIELWSKYGIFSGWGFDKVLCSLTKEQAAVIHEYQMYHPKKDSSYDKSKAFAEMDLLTKDIFPKFMEEKYGEIWFFDDTQKEYELIMKTN